MSSPACCGRSTAATEGQHGCRRRWPVGSPRSSSPPGRHQPADQRRRRPLCRVLGLAGRAPARRALLVPRRRRRRTGRAGARTGPDTGDARPGAGPGGRCPAFLETGTPRNVPFYQSLGFQIETSNEPRMAGPTIWFMQTPRSPPTAKHATASNGSAPSRWPNAPARNCVPQASAAACQRLTRWDGPASRRSYRSPPWSEGPSLTWEIGERLSDLAPDGREPPLPGCPQS